MQTKTKHLARLALALALTSWVWLAQAQESGEPLALDVETQAQPSEQEAEKRHEAAADRVRAQAQRERDRAQREQERAQMERERFERLYERASQALEDGRYERAIEAFEELAAQKGKKGDAALYWKAYALQKKGRRPEALATLERLRGEFPQSRWLNDGQALELEIRQKSGERPSLDVLADDDLKIFALSQLMNGSSEEALPVLEKLLTSGKSPRVREHALFVLCQSKTPRALEIVARIARGQGSPALESKAIEYLGMVGGEDSRRILGEIYAQSPEPDSRRAVLRGFMMSGDKARVLQVARSEKDLELRQEALQSLGMLGANAELYELYRAETNRDLKQAILRGLMMAGDAGRLIELARGEKDPELRRELVQALSMLDAPEARQFMLEILEK